MKLQEMKVSCSPISKTEASIELSYYTFAVVQTGHDIHPSVHLTLSVLPLKNFRRKERNQYAIGTEHEQNEKVFHGSMSSWVSLICS